jgi:hypothetical protein
MADKDANPLDGWVSGEFPADLLSAATSAHIQRALEHEDARIAVLRLQTRSPGSPTDVEFRERWVRAAQLRNALNESELARFWEALRHGCADEVGEESDPAIRYADARYNEWDQSRRVAFDQRFNDAMQADMSPAGRVLRAIELTEATELEAVKRRIALYAMVSAELKRDSMLSPESLDRLLCRILRNVGSAFINLQGRIHRYFAAAGWSDRELSIDRYLHPALRVRYAVQNAIEVLRTKHKATHQQETPAPLSSKQNSVEHPDDFAALDHLLDGKTDVDLYTAAEYLGKGIDHVRRLARERVLKVTRERRPKLVSVRSLRAFRLGKSE